MAELFGALFKRRSQIEEEAETYESTPEESSADASHLEKLSFGETPDVTSWMQKHQTPEEDRVAELLSKGLEDRGLLPAHAPTAPESNSLLWELSRELENARHLLQEQQQKLRLEQAEVTARDQALVERENAVAASKKALEEEMAKASGQDDYPPPPWLDQRQGTANVGVVGESGVGKSLLINKLRHIESGNAGWAEVGVNETTMEARAYPFPNEDRVRLWDLPGCGTTAFPRAAYVSTMGLRYFDSVLVVSAGRFTEMEVQLSAELEKYNVPHFMVRTKLDMDIVNNLEDNNIEEAQTLALIHDELKARGVEHPYLVSSRWPKKYDMARLLRDLFPVLQALPNVDDDIACDDWDDAWALPEAHTGILSGVQGRWNNGSTMYYVHGLEVHVTRQDGTSALAMLGDSPGFLWWCENWSISEKAVKKAVTTGVLLWHSTDRRKRPFKWTWMN